MAELVSDNNLIIRLSGDEIDTFAQLISEVRNAYSPPQKVGFQLQPKFNVPENIGEFSMNMYIQLFGDETEGEEN